MEQTERMAIRCSGITKTFGEVVANDQIELSVRFGEVLALLKEKGLDERTLVIFTSDNGPHEEGGADPVFFGRDGRLRGLKRQTYEGGIRVPFIVNQPGRVPVRQLSNPIYFPDMMPTLAAIAGAGKHLPAHTDGMDVSPLFVGKEMRTDNRMLYWEFPGKQRAARKGKWKCVTIRPNKPLELYDLEADPGETRNLAKDYPALVEQMDKEMRRMRTPSPYWPLADD